MIHIRLVIDGLEFGQDETLWHVHAFLDEQLLNHAADLGTDLNPANRNDVAFGLERQLVLVVGGWGGSVGNRVVRAVGCRLGWGAQREEDRTGRQESAQQPG